MAENPAILTTSDKVAVLQTVPKNHMKRNETSQALVLLIMDLALLWDKTTLTF